LFTDWRKGNYVKSVNKSRAFAAVLSVVLVAALAIVGGVSYAANAVTHVAHVAKKIVAPSSGKKERKK